MSVFIPEDRLDALARKVGAGPYARPTPQPVAQSNTDFSVREDGQNCLLTVPGVGEVKLLSTLVANGVQKTHAEWCEYSRTNPDDVLVPNSVLIYQMLRGLYRANNDSVRDKCLLILRQNIDRPLHTGTKVRYKTGLEATITHMQLDKSDRSFDLGIPEFTRYDNTWSYLILAKEQPESALGNTELIPDNAKPVLEALLGEGYEETGTVIQYMSSRKNNNLREVRLWTPTTTNRNTEWAVVLGVGYGRFGIGAYYGIINRWPALGVVYAGAKNFQRK